ncbi:MAG: hypothetical protein AB1540_04635 [Bdellovibrionota bacterium]
MSLLGVTRRLIWSSGGKQKTIRFVWVFCLFLSAITRAEQAIDAQLQLEPHPEVLRSCDLATVMTLKERQYLISKLRISKAGQTILENFKRQYGTLEKLALQWDQVSYSKITDPPAGPPPASERPSRALAQTTPSRGRVSRALAGLNKKAREDNSPNAPLAQPRGPQPLGRGVCVHLTKNLPEIEHVADLAHELTHATKLELKVLRGDVETAEQFVGQRLGSSGGEADAFATECTVKREILGEWDPFCAPYVHDGKISREKVLQSLYSGQLSASLTGESYPTLLTRQFQALLRKRIYSGLENKRGIQ